MKDIMKGVQTEVDASYLYQLLASKEDDPVVAKVFAEMSQIEKSHAVSFCGIIRSSSCHFLGPPGARDCSQQSARYSDMITFLVYCWTPKKACPIQPFRHEKEPRRVPPCPIPRMSRSWKTS